MERLSVVIFNTAFDFWRQFEFLQLAPSIFCDRPPALRWVGDNGFDDDDENQDYVDSVDDDDVEYDAKDDDELNDNDAIAYELAQAQVTTKRFRRKYL